MRVNVPNLRAMACDLLLSKKPQAWPRAARLSSVRGREGELRFNARARRRVILITIAGLCVTFGAIILINLTPPRGGLQSKSHARMNKPAPPKIEPVQSNDNAAATPAPPLSLAQPAARASDNLPATDFATSTPAPGLVNEADVAALRVKGLLIPVAGV